MGHLSKISMMYRLMLGGQIVGSIQVSSSKYDDETKVQTSVKVYASEEKQKQEDKTELHKSIAKALGCKVN
jgi:hypothetical protein